MPTPPAVSGSRSAGPLAAALLSVALAACATGEARTPPAEPEPPVVRDPRLQLTLFAADPQIVTPIGIAVDASDRVYVLESHTHLPPKGYEGPAGDRVRVFTDGDGNGAPERVSTFAEGLEDGMNLAFSPAGELYVVTSRAVYALHDRDGDGASEARTRVLSLARPERVYDHAALLGVTFGPDGWMYVSRGNTGGAAWRMEGTDGTALSGYGDGGNIVRARPDGSGLEQVATGFWNPFDLRFDRAGRLLAADNDPDSRGPNRLVHVVPGGDYGYQALFGGSGIHPYLAWNGELPGTLPFAAGLGEAPSGLLVADDAALPPDYRGTLLATIWEESRIDRVRVTPHGVSVRGEVEPLVVGGARFRPVALAADSRGNVYITDWVVRAYPNHGRGRIWRLSARPGVERMPSVPASRPPRDAGAAVPGDLPDARRALLSGDPFERHAAVMALAGPALLPHALEATRDPDARVRLGALLALRRAAHPGGEEVARRLLGDPDPAVRRMALIWAGSAGMLALRPELERALDAGAPSPEVFEAYLATVELLTPQFVAARAARAQQPARTLPRELPPRLVERLVADPSRPAALRAVALAHLPDPAEQVALLARLARHELHPELRLEAVRSLAMTRDSAGAAALLAVAEDAAAPSALRAEALASLARQPLDAAAVATRLLRDPDAEVRLEAARLLRAEPDSAQRPQSPDGWRAALATGGDPARGRRVFFSPLAACAQCHTVQRRGGDIGPDLTQIGRSKTRAQLVHSILRPSDEVSPEWQGWYVKTPDGQTHVGRQIDVEDPGAQLYMLQRGFVNFPEVSEYGPAARSLMPDGLERGLSVAELRDLVAFLERGPSAAPHR